jgi:hypothetical protein
MVQHIIHERPNGFTVFIHKPEASGRERILSQGFEHMPVYIEAYGNLQAHYMLRYTSAF